MSTTITSIGDDGQRPMQGTSSRTSSTAAKDIALWLRRFASRQARMLLVQGTAMALLAILAGASVLMLLDAVGWIDDATRWCLALANYAIAFGVGCMFGWARFWTRPKDTQLAQQAECAAPELKESLLSCVELQRVAPSERYFSPGFLGGIEQHVAMQLRDISHQQLLPWRIVRKPIMAAALAVVSIGALCAIPKLEMQQRIVRAFVPFFEVARPSRCKITVLSPSRPSTTVPENQRMAFEIEVSGESVDAAFLELQSESPGKGASIERVPMRLMQASPQVFSCNATIGTQPLRYRFLAGDAITNFRHISPSPRPRAIAFHHRLTFPEYAKIGTVEWVSDQGHITLLANAKLSIGIEPSMPLVSASLVVESLDSSERITLPLALDADRNRWVGDWDVRGDARYQVKLVADLPDSDQSIENTYSPFYEVNAVTDHAPNVIWMTEAQTLWTLAPDANQAWMVAPQEIVHLAVAAADDLPGVVLEQEFSINRQPWERVPVEIPTETLDTTTSDRNQPLVTWPSLDGLDTPEVAPSRVTASWQWDLLSTSAVSGDTVSIRVAARDSLGQRSYSQPIQLSIASPGFDRNRHDALYLRSTLAPELKQLADWMKEKRPEIRARLLSLKERTVSREQRETIAKEIQEWIQEWSRQCRSLRQRTSQMVGALPRVLDQSDLELVDRVLARWEREFASQWLMSSQSTAWESLEESAQPTPLLVERLFPMLQHHIDRSVALLDEAESSTTQLNEIYRQMLGHECLTAMTKDLTYLWNHQKDQVAKADTLDFARLSRSQLIAEQYIDAVTQLGDRMEPMVSQHLSNQMKNLYRFLDQTRTELRDCVQAEPSSRAQQTLLKRIERSVYDLQHQHWAFHLDGGLWWSLPDARRALINLGHGTGNAMQRAIDVGKRAKEWTGDKRLDSETVRLLRSASFDEMTQSHLPAATTMLGRRDFHLHRQPTDPMFPSDMGMASRAWSSTMESWLSEQPGTESWNQTLDRLQAITKAYRILEVAHELADIELVLEALHRQEQYDWESLEGRLSHLKQWDSLNHRIDSTHQWMKEANFPSPIPDQFNALRWAASFQQARQKFEPRRNADLPALTSAAMELQSVLENWAESRVQSQPTIDEARRLLSQMAPSVSQLAQRAERETRELQKQTETLNPDGESQRQSLDSQVESLAEPKSETEVDPPREAVSPKQWNEQQRRVDRSMEQLQDALVEMALRQDILDALQLQAAKDSDRALELLDRVEQPMREAAASLTELRNQSQDAAKVAEAASQASQRQEQTAQALETIANHFERLQAAIDRPDPSDANALEQSRQQLQQQNAAAAEEERQRDSDNPSQSPADVPDEPLANYEQANQLGELARSSPEELLKKLESELNRNRPMQKELSEISQSNVADSVSQLRNAAAQEANLAKQLENSDPSVVAGKEIQIQQLKAIADSADRFAANLLSKSTQAVNRMNQPEARRSLQELSESLKAAANQAKNTDGNATQASLQEKTRTLQAQVEKAQRELAELAPRFQQLTAQSTFKEDNQRQSQLTEMQSWQSLMRDDLVRRAKDQTREREQQAERLTKEWNNRERELEQKTKERNQSIERASKSPENESLQSQIDQKTKEVQQAMQKAESAKQLVESARRIEKQGQEQQQRIEQAPRANLDAANPLAALAQEQLSIAKSQLDQLQSGLESMQAKNATPAPRAPSSDALSQSEPQQQQVASSVEQVAQQLARSARHEARLGNTPAEKTLSQQSEKVAKAAGSEVAKATDDLEQLASESKQQEKSQLQTARSESSLKPYRGPSGETAIRDLLQAQKALNQQAKELQQSAGSGPDASAKPNNAKEASPPLGSSAPSAKQLARMLDSLDQQLNQQLDAEKIGAENGTQANDEMASNSSHEPSSGQSKEANPSPSSADGKPNDEQRDAQDGKPSSSRAIAKPSSDALRDSAEQVASQLQNERLANREAAKQKKEGQSRKQPGQNGGRPNDGGLTQNPPTGNSNLPKVLFESGDDWGRLREKRADDLVEGRREIYDPEFSEAIRAYYRALGNPTQNRNDPRN